MHTRVCVWYVSQCSRKRRAGKTNGSRNVLFTDGWKGDGFVTKPASFGRPCRFRFHPRSWAHPPRHTPFECKAFIAAVKIGRAVWADRAALQNSSTCNCIRTPLNKIIPCVPLIAKEDKKRTFVAELKTKKGHDKHKSYIKACLRIRPVARGSNGRCVWKAGGPSPFPSHHHHHHHILHQQQQNENRSGTILTVYSGVMKRLMVELTLQSQKPKVFLRKRANVSVSDGRRLSFQDTIFPPKNRLSLRHRRHDGDDESLFLSLSLCWF